MRLPSSPQAAGWVWLFLAAIGATAAQLTLDREVVPYTGTLATVALLGLAAARGEGPGRSRRAGLAGLAALSLAAGAVDAARGGFGWPLDVSTQAGPAAIVLGAAGAVLLSAVVLLSVGVLMPVGVLGRVSPGLRRRRLWPAAVLGVLCVLALAVNVAYPAVERDEAEPSHLAVLAVLAPPVAALLLVILAVNAAFALGRRTRTAAVGLLAMLALAGATVGAAADLEILHRPAPTDEVNAGAHSYVAVVVFPADGTALGWSAAHLSPDAAVRAMQERALAEALAASSGGNSLRSSAYARGVAVATPAIAFTEPPAPVAISWRMDPWQGEFDWSRLLPAILASVLLLGLAALTEAVFPPA